MAVEQVVVSIDGGPGMDSKELALLSRRLRAELAELDMESVDYSTNLPPSGAKTWPQIKSARPRKPLQRQA